MKIKAKEVTKRAKSMINGNYKYIYGAKGQKITKKLVASLARSYPGVYTSTIRAKAYSKVGKGRGIDCSGFVSKATKTDYGGSANIRSHMTSVHNTSDRSAIVDGMVCYRTGHIGLIEVDANGNAWILEAQSTATDLKRTPIEERLSHFTIYGKLDKVNYSGANVYKKSTKAHKTTGKTMKVNTSGNVLICRKTAHIDAPVVGKFKNGTKIEVLEKTSSSWYKIKGKDTTGKTVTGYSKTKYLK